MARPAAISPVISDNGDVSLSGTLAAKGNRGQGGRIDLTGSNVTILGALIDASGATRGGVINIGGDAHGGGTLAHALSTDIDSTTIIRADALDNGSGGAITVWSDGQTTAQGTFTARGGSNGGNGGTIETSGQVLSVNGITVNASATNGKPGIWLLDPTDLIIDATLAGEIDAVLANDTSVTLQTTASGNPTAPFALTANETNTSGNGDIIVNSALTWGTNAVLTLSAFNSIAVNAPITIGGGSLALNAANAIAVNAPVTVNGAGAVSLVAGYDTTTVPGVSLLELAFGNGASLTYANADGTPATSAVPGQALTINGQAYTLLYTMVDMQAINASDTALQGNYALAASQDASTTTNWIPIGTDGLGNIGNAGNGFSGVFEGLGHTIANLTVSMSTSFDGLFGVNSGAIRDIGMVGGSVSGPVAVGGLVGLNAGTISQSFATSAVAGSIEYVGGLVGTNNDGTISQSYATGAVSGGTAGGLVGFNFGGRISQSYAAGAVTGGQFLGGLVGLNDVQGGLGGTVSQSYATGAVTGATGDVGGLVGTNDGTISQSYATGAATGSDVVGGLAGQNFGTISQSYATGAVSGSTNLGGLLGQGGFGSTVTQSYWDIQSSGQTERYQL